MDVEVAIFRALAREEKVIYCDDGEETTMECGTLHFRNKVFPKSSSAASSEGSDNDDDAGEEEDNPTNDVEDDANNNEEEDQEDTAPEEEEQSEDVPSNGWADLV
jgi:hypothetical protein